MPITPTEKGLDLTRPSLPDDADDARVPEPVRVSWDIRPMAFVKIAAALAIAYTLINLSFLILLSAMSILLAVTIDPVVAWLAKRGVPRWVGILLIAFTIAGTIALGIAVVIPTLVTQVGVLVQDLPKIRDDLLSQVPAPLRHNTLHILAHPEQAAGGSISGHLLTVGGIALGGVSETGLMLILALYFLVDGKRAYAWLLAFFAPKTRMKLRKTGAEVSEVMFAYVAGQLITSALVTVYAFAVLSLLKVPAPLILALLAGVFDILPIIGFFLSTGPAAMLALTVSPTTGLAVIGLYLLYHAIENYWIVPKVYGNRLRLSTLAVLLALLVGGILAGIPGAILVLPLVASYPIVEAIWLKPVLGEAVIERHIAQQEQSDDASSKRKGEGAGGSGT